ncbi:MAG: tetraacyldisaccharide 4'-kinase, partial [Bacteroidia bacterium]
MFLPFSWLYGGIMYIRNMLYDTNLFKVHSFDIHTIGIGNLSMGGDGKTPMAEYLIELCKSQGIQPSVLSRGYKRNSKGFVF